MPFQPSCTHSRLKSHPPSNELAIVMALGQWLPLKSEKVASLPEMARRPFSKPIRAQEERNGPPRFDQGLSTAKPKSSHVTWAEVETRPPPPVPTFLLSQNLSPKDIAGSDITS